MGHLSKGLYALMVRFLSELGAPSSAVSIFMWIIFFVSSEILPCVLVLLIIHRISKYATKLKRALNSPEKKPLRMQVEQKIDESKNYETVS